jgi:hypothetical protein
MKMTNKQIRLDRIIDVLDSARGAYECLAGTTPLIRDPDKFSVEFCRMSFVTKPLTLVQKKDGYYLVAGYKQWQMALRLFDKTEKVRCSIITDVSTDFLNAMAWNEVYGDILLHGLSPKYIGYQLGRVTDIGKSTYYEKEPIKESKAKSYDDVLKDISAEQSGPKKLD